MSRLTRDETAEPVSRGQILRHVRGQRNIHFPCSADHEQDWQPYPVDPYSAICDGHRYIHIYIHTHYLFNDVTYYYKIISINTSNTIDTINTSNNINTTNNINTNGGTVIYSVWAVGRAEGSRQTQARHTQNSKTMDDSTCNEAFLPNFGNERRYSTLLLVVLLCII